MTPVLFIQPLLFAIAIATGAYITLSIRRHSVRQAVTWAALAAALTVSALPVRHTLIGVYVFLFIAGAAIGLAAGYVIRVLQNWDRV